MGLYGIVPGDGLWGELPSQWLEGVAGGASGYVGQSLKLGYRGQATMTGGELLGGAYGAVKG
ncbi:MAG: hypothetical protein JO287_20555 [Pseudonocardiales bacterium]|nr:hypothetical protein [Pseudonocardiales bacterium]